jgi:hypothetical protein
MRSERWPINEANVLAAGDASAIKLKNTKSHNDALEQQQRFQTILLELIMRGLHERAVISTTNSIYSH